MTPRFPPGAQCWVDLLGETGTFYAGLFGWRIREDGVAYADGRAVAGIGPQGTLPRPAWLTRVRVGDAGDAVARALAAGASLLAEPAPARPDGRIALLADPDGAAFAVWETGAGDGAGLVNEPGSWDLSTLHAPAPGAAREFYATLFGWQADPYPAMTLWRLPGYCGGVPGQPVPRDTVAVMTAGGPAGWSVDFRVLDADATAAQALRRGGSVHEGPRDTPGFRSAELADPHGTRFSVTQFRWPASSRA